ncbi:MAG TPA: hypothetical protein VEJ67_18800 [Candidatus Cybelea sp.]|nr:hypothetical protein [Candidatus Cybelea sp.]
MKKWTVFLLASLPVMVVVGFAAMNPPSVQAVPSYARQTGLACSGCHYTPPELNPAGRRFKLLGYVDKQDKSIKAEAGKQHAPLDILESLPLSVMFETSYTSLGSPVPGTQNGNVEFPQDVSLYLSGAWTKDIGSFLQVTYDTQNDHFSIDNTDIRYAKTKNLGGKEFNYGLDLNNNPSVEDLWNATPAWGFPWIQSDFAPLPTAEPILNGPLAQDVGGGGAYAMWDNHLYGAVLVYGSDHVGIPQPNPGTGFTYNIHGAAPYWRFAWQQGTPTTQFEIGTYGMHVESTPQGVVGPEDEYTDWALDSQVDRTLFKRDVLSLRGTFIDQTSWLTGSVAAVPPAATAGSHHLYTATANVEYHFGNRISLTGAFFDTWGTADPLLYPQAPVTGSANGNPGSTGYFANASFWPWQNIQLAFQYSGYTRFNGGGTNYDAAGRDASGNNTTYLLIRFLF